MKQSSLHLGLKFYLLVSTLFGIKCFHIAKKNLLWINLFQSLYNISLLIAEVTFVPAYVTQVLVDELRNYQITSSNAINNGINNAIVVACRLIWITTLTFNTIYTRIYWKLLVKSVKKLTILANKFDGKLKENYYTFFLCLGLNAIYLGIFWSAKFGKMNDQIAFWVRLAFTFYGHTFPIFFCSLYFCAVEQLLLMTKDLNKEVNLWKNRRLTLPGSRKCYSNFHKNSKTADIDNFKQNLYALLNITEETLDYFQIPVSLIFLNNLVYLISEITRITTASSYELLVLLSLISNSLLISVILNFGDSVYRKTAALANFLYKMAADEESFQKRNQIYGICKVLERFPKISFFGFFTIGRHCLLPILSSFITYLIVGFQFSLSNTGGNNCTCNNS
ncbi:UNVERIFIED_CONTAM: hypothetical protein RMT77_007953 [Armadillidium vulgare]